MSVRTTAGIHGPKWSRLAADYEAFWSRLAEPVRAQIADHTGIGPGTRLLDVGCGPGAMLRFAADRGARVSGLDAAEGMIAHARALVPDADLRVGPMERLPWDDGAFDVVTAFNAVQFAADRAGALREMDRVRARGGHVAVASWGPPERCQQFVIGDALEALAGQEQAGTHPLGADGVLAELFEAAGLTPRITGEVEAPMVLPDRAALETAFWVDVVDIGLLERVDEATARAAIASAAEPFRRPDGSYRLENVFRFAVG
jgi:SAM-dependent methyltransferase